MNLADRMADFAERDRQRVAALVRDRELAEKVKSLLGDAVEALAGVVTPELLEMAAGELLKAGLGEFKIP